VSSVRWDHDFQTAVLHSNQNKQLRPQFINPAFILRRFLVIQVCWCCRAGYRILIVLLWCCPAHNYCCSYCCCFILLRLGLRSDFRTEPKVSRCCHVCICRIIYKKKTLDDLGLLGCGAVSLCVLLLPTFRRIIVHSAPRHRRLNHRQEHCENLKFRSACLLLMHYEHAYDLFPFKPSHVQLRQPTNYLCETAR